MYKRQVYILTVLTLILCCVLGFVNYEDTYGEQINRIITFGRNIEISGVYGEHTASFNVDNSIMNLDKANMVIYYTTGNITGKDFSNLTIELNGTKFYSSAIVRSNIDRRKLMIELPLEFVKDGYNELRITVYHRITEEGLCFDDINPGNWIVLHNDSYIELVQKYKGEGYIKNYPSPYIFSNNNIPDEVKVILEDEPKTAEITAYMGLCADLGIKNKSDVMNIKILGVDSINNLNSNSIYIGLKDNLSKDILDLLDTEDKAILSSNSLIKSVQLSNTSSKRLLMLIGNNETGLNSIMDFMHKEKLLSQVRGNKIVLMGSSEDKKPTTYPSQLSLEEIGYGNILKRGSFDKSANFSVNLPANWKIKKTSKFYLKCKISKPLDLKTSSITVYINSIPLDSKLIRENDGEIVTYEFDLDPLAVENSNSMDVKIDFFLRPEFDICLPSNQDGIWFFISKESYFDIDYDDENNFELDNIVGAFIKEKLVMETAILVEGNVTEQLENIGKLAMYLGKNGQGINSFRYLNEVGSSNDNLIVIDLNNSNEFIKNIKDELKLTFKEHEAMYAGDGDLAELINFNRELGVLQLFSSPKDSSRSVLLISGENQQAIDSAVDVIVDSTLNAKLKSDVALVSKAGDVYTSSVQEKKSNSHSQSYNPSKIELSYDTMKIVVIIAVILILIITGAIFIIRLR